MELTGLKPSWATGPRAGVHQCLPTTVALPSQCLRPHPPIALILHREALRPGLPEWLSGPGPGGSAALLQEQGCPPGVCCRAEESGPGLCLRSVHNRLAGGWHPRVSLQPPQLPYLGVYGVQQLACRDSRTGYMEWTVASSMFDLFIIYLCVCVHVHISF